MQIKPMAFFGGIGVACAGALGFVLGGPKLAVGGAKAALALAVQAGIAMKVENGIDKAAEKVDNAADKFFEICGNTVEKVADIWSKFFLIGYGTTIAFQGANTSTEMYVKFCEKGIISSAVCIGNFLTTSSFQFASLVCSTAIVREVYKITFR